MIHVPNLTGPSCKWTQLHFVAVDLVPVELEPFQVVSFSRGSVQLGPVKLGTCTINHFSWRQLSHFKWSQLSIFASVATCLTSLKKEWLLVIAWHFPMISRTRIMVLRPGKRSQQQQKIYKRGKPSAHEKKKRKKTGRKTRRRRKHCVLLFWSGLTSRSVSLYYFIKFEITLLGEEYVIFFHVLKCLYQIVHCLERKRVNFARRVVLSVIYSWLFTVLCFLPSCSRSF